VNYRIAVIEFPGTNCERETARAVQRADMDPIRFKWNDDPAILASCDGYVIGGGFSYEDRSRSGIIAALDPIMRRLRVEDKKGKPILGICNGAQILLESGIIPGLSDHRLGGALAQNKQFVDGKIIGTGFYNAWVHVRLSEGSGSHAFVRGISTDTVMRIPAAHAEGRFVIPRGLLEHLYASGATIFRYCDVAGNENPQFPCNPNGSVDNIAALGNLRGNALGIMPHPERTNEGDCMFASMRTYLSQGLYRESIDLDFSQKEELSGVYTPGVKSRELVISSIITDNTAVSVEQALRQLGFPVSVRRAVHWELTPAPDATEHQFEQDFATACKSGELFNSNKEYPVEDLPATDRTILVRTDAEDDCIGLHAKHVLMNWFGLPSIVEIRHGILWMITVDPDQGTQSEHMIEECLHTNIFNNPFSHRRYTYA